MTIQGSFGVYDYSEFIYNPEPRCPIVLILDISRSMKGGKFDTVKRALIKFRDIIREDPVTALRADVAVIEFDHQARVVQGFTNGTDFEPPTIKLNHKLNDATNYSKAIDLALDIIEARKQSYRDDGIAYFRSLVYFLTDGYLEQDSDADLARAAARISEMEWNHSVAFFCFGIGSPDQAADMSVLANLAPRQPVELTAMGQLDGSIQWLSHSGRFDPPHICQPGEHIHLPQPGDYLNF